MNKNLFTASVMQLMHPFSYRIMRKKKLACLEEAIPLSLATVNLDDHVSD